MLHVEGLSAGYGESLVLSDVKIEVPAGQVVCLIGRNGVGKTTLMKAVVGALRPREGRIHFDGVDVTAYPPYKRIRAGVGYVPQGRGIFPYLTVHENLLMGLEGTSSVPASAIDEMYTQFPALQSSRTRLAGALSGGQQQQLAIARALIRRPRLLLLDEPTEGIQPSIVEEIAQVVLALRERRDVAVLLVEQFLDFALAVSDAYYVMQKGTIVAQGPIAELSDRIVSEHLAV